MPTMPASSRPSRWRSSERTDLAPPLCGLPARIRGGSLALPACKILPTEQASQQSGVDTFFDDKSFDPDKMVRDMWDTKVIPYLTSKAGAFPQVRDLARTSP